MYEKAERLLDEYEGEEVLLELVETVTEGMDPDGDIGHYKEWFSLLSEAKEHDPEWFEEVLIGDQPTHHIHIPDPYSPKEPIRPTCNHPPLSEMEEVSYDEVSDGTGIPVDRVKEIAAGDAPHEEAVLINTYADEWATENLREEESDEWDEFCRFIESNDISWGQVIRDL